MSIRLKVRAFIGRKCFRVNDLIRCKVTGNYYFIESEETSHNKKKFVIRKIYDVLEYDLIDPNKDWFVRKLTMYELCKEYDRVLYDKMHMWLFFLTNKKFNKIGDINLDVDDHILVSSQNDDMLDTIEGYELFKDCETQLVSIYCYTGNEIVKSYSLSFFKK